MSRKPWEIPMQYNEDRFTPEPATALDATGASTGHGELDAHDIDELLSRPERREEREYECNDTTPLDYKKGPHDDEFGVDDHEFDEHDADPVPYENQPHDRELGVDDDDEDDGGSGSDFGG